MNLPVIDPANASPEAKVLLDAVKAKLGVVPNMMRMFAVNPAVLRAYLDFSSAIGSGLGLKLNGKIALAVAQENGCDYCLAAHTLLGNKAGITADDMMSARAGKGANAREAAAIKLALALVSKHGGVSADEVKAARDAGLSDADVLEVIAAVAINIFTNYANKAAATDIDFPPAARLSYAA
jgi:uncharacterized peroxidase-related enzyme